MIVYPIFIPHLGCPFECIYCNQHQITKVEEPDLRPIYENVKQFCQNHPEEDKEIAFFGGTFTGLPQVKQKELLTLLSPLLDKTTSIRISTRPDCINSTILGFLKNNGVQTIELGIQSFYNQVLSETKRGYTAETAVSNCYKIQEFGFQLGIQIMPGLPGFSEQSLETTMKQIIAIKPDFIRVYPTIILKSTKLEQLYNDDKYSPLSLEKSIEICANISNLMQQHKTPIIKMGLHSDIDPEAVIAGPYHQAFGELVRAEIIYKKLLNDFEKGKTLHISPADVSLFLGFKKQMLIKLKSALNLTELALHIDNSLTKSHYTFSDITADKIW